MRGQTSSYVISTLLGPPDSTLLTSLVNVKDELSLTDPSNDTTLTRFITEESAGISRYCNRIFGLAIWQDEFRPQRGIGGEGVRAPNNPLKLTKWPLAAAPVLFTGTTHATTVIDGIPSTTGLYEGMPVFGQGLQAYPNSAGAVAAGTFGDGIPVGATIAAVTTNSITLSVAVTDSQVGVSFTAGLSVVETVAGVSYQLVAGIDFEIDAGSLLPGDEGDAFLYRLNERGHPRTWPATKIVVGYQAGYALPNDEYGANYSPLPTDLEGACIRLVVGRFRARGRDPMLRSRSQGANLGVEQYWVGSTPGNSGPYPNEIMAILSNYRVPVTA